MSTNVTEGAIGVLTKELDAHREESYKVIDSLTRALMALDARLDSLETEMDLLARRLVKPQAVRKDEEGKEL
jgi:CII-binding regulator of phage lambda lysogenization HflD